MTAPTTSPAPSLLRPLGLALLVAVLAIGCYLNAMGGEFVYDDYPIVVNNTILRAPYHLHELFTVPKHINVNMWGFHRPITILTYWIDLRIFGLNPFGFHLENLLWHTVTALLVLVLLRELWPEEPLMALVGALLFAVHPVHTEAVAWVSGRSEILAAFWGLLAFWAHRRADRGMSKASLWRIAALAAWLVALGAKEMAATLPLLLVMSDVLLGGPSGWWRPGRLATRYGPYFVAGVAYVAFRVSVQGHFGPSELHQPFQGAPLGVRGATMLKVGAAYVGRLIFPVNLNADWAVPYASGLTDGVLPLLALALLVWLVGLAWAVRRTAPPVGWGILWAGLALLPVSNIVPIGEIGAERFLYFSSVGACAALAWVMTRGIKPLTRASTRAPIFLAGALVCTVLLLFAANTIDRNRDWADDLVLWEKTVDRSPANARAIGHLGYTLWRKGRPAEGEALLKRAVAIREKDLGPDPDHRYVAINLNNLAALYIKQGQYAQGEPVIKRALAIREKALGPDHPDVAQSLNNLAVLYRAQGQYAKAEPVIKRALAIREKALGPEHPAVAASFNNLAQLYQFQGQYADAEPLFKRALSILEKTVPNHPNLATFLDNLAKLYIKMGRDDEAVPLLNRARKIQVGL